MTLHSTPTRLKALKLVRDKKIRWSIALGTSGGFMRRDWQRIDPNLLVALWELKFATLVCVEHSTVSLTISGVARLSEWDTARAGRSS